MDLGLDGARAAVMASSKGLGRAVATELVREGATTIVSSRDADNLRSAKESILDETGAGPDDVQTAVCDLSNPGTIESRLKPVIETIGGLDVLVTNHGGTEPLTFEEADVSVFDDAYESVFKSTVCTVKTALPYLKTGGGSITNVISASTLEPGSGSVLNGSIRASVYGLSKVLAEEYSDRGIRTNCISPRAIMTERLKYKIELLAEREGISFEQARKRREAELPIERIGDPAEFGRAVTYVASPAAGFVTGSVLQVDGGWHAHAFG